MEHVDKKWFSQKKKIDLQLASCVEVGLPALILMVFISHARKFGAFFASIPLPIMAALYCVFFGYVITCYDFNGVETSQSESW
ncbi:uncharacterized protein LOC123887556 [Trifolium pratense]|uniref:uncharacterized protein LOC123887556 n=1 Tax=Trifolium pratense TaxID=57577 RepID=UPI001E692EC5|nr:uncharacterized protein LOC123887556 [Trifolium pratense]